MSSQQVKGAIEDITGEPVSGVAFVQDYVELHFDGKVVRALAMPTVILGDARYTFPEPGSRDALCALIGLTVKSVAIKAGIDIEIVFFGEARVCIPLVLDERSGPEAAHYVPGANQPLSVW